MINVTLTSYIDKGEKLLNYRLTQIDKSKFLLVHFLNLGEQIDEVSKRYDVAELNQYKLSVLVIDETEMLYLGKGGKEIAPDKILNHIHEVQEELELNNFRTILVGEGLGALASITLSREINPKFLIVKKPIVRVGTYIDSILDINKQKIEKRIFGINKTNGKTMLDNLFINKVNTVGTKYWRKTKVYLDDNLNIKDHFIDTQYLKDKKIDYSLLESKKNEVDLKLEVLEKIEKMKYIRKPILFRNQNNQLDLKLEFKNLNENCDWAFYFYSNKKIVCKKLYNNEVRHIIDMPELKVTHIKVFLRGNKKIEDVQVFPISY